MAAASRRTSVGMNRFMSRKTDFSPGTRPAEITARGASGQQGAARTESIGTSEGGELGGGGSAGLPGGGRRGPRGTAAFEERKGVHRCQPDGRRHRQARQPPEVRERRARRLARRFQRQHMLGSRVRIVPARMRGTGMIAAPLLPRHLGLGQVHPRMAVKRFQGQLDGDPMDVEGEEENRPKTPPPTRGGPRVALWS